MRGVTGTGVCKYIQRSRHSDDYPWKMSHAIDFKWDIWYPLLGSTLWQKASTSDSQVHCKNLFVNELAQVGPSGLYQSASEYIRDLVRRDYEREEENRGEALYEELRSGAGAPLSEFVALDVEAVIREAKKRRVSSAK